MSRDRWLPRVVLALTGLLGAAGWAAASTAPNTGEGAVLRIQITGSAGSTEGTCFLVHQERRERDVIQYFLTSARLFDLAPLGERRTALLRIRVMVDESSVIDASGSDVVFPGGTEQGVDVAVVKVISASSSLVPVAVSMEPFESGQAFVVRDHHGNAWPERVRFRSTRLVLGDRTAAEMTGILGAPATIEGGVFGLVSECSSSRVPVITRLSAARGFLARAIPGWTLDVVVPTRP